MADVCSGEKKGEINASEERESVLTFVGCARVIVRSLACVCALSLSFGVVHCDMIVCGKEANDTGRRAFERTSVCFTSL